MSHKSHSSKPSKVSLKKKSSSKSHTLNSPNNNFLTDFFLDSKVSTLDRFDTTATPGINVITQFKDEPNKTISQSAVDINIITNTNSSGLSVLKMFEQESSTNCLEISYVDGHHTTPLKESDQNRVQTEASGSCIKKSQSKFRDEVNCLTSELKMKDSLIEKLFKENIELRREIEELLVTVEETKEKVVVTVKGCHQRIQELEKEVKTFKEENKQYQEPLLTRNNRELSQQTGLRNLEEYIGRFHNETKEKMENFHKILNEQFTDFMTDTRTQYQTFNRMVHDQIQEAQKENQQEIEEIKTMRRYGSPQTRPRFLTPKPETQGKRHLRQPTAANNSPINTERPRGKKSTSRRARMLTIQNVQDMYLSSNSENIMFNGGLIARCEVNGNGRKSPKGLTKRESSGVRC